jgi:hypothetical protein
MATYTINTTPSPKPAPKPASRDPRSKSMATIAGTFILIGVGIAAYIFWPERLPPADASPAELIKFAVSDKFANLPEAKRQVYVDAMMKNRLGMFAAFQQAKLTDDQRESLFMNAMSLAMNKRLDEWMKLDEKGKQQYVQNMVKEMGQRPPGAPGGAGAANRGAGGPGGRGGPRNMTPERQKRFIENTSPGRRAAMGEFMASMRKARDAAEKK